MLIRGSDGRFWPCNNKGEAQESAFLSISYNPNTIFRHYFDKQNFEHYSKYHHQGPCHLSFDSSHSGLPSVLEKTKVYLSSRPSRTIYSSLPRADFSHTFWTNFNFFKCKYHFPRGITCLCRLGYQLLQHIPLYPLSLFVKHELFLFMSFSSTCSTSKSWAPWRKKPCLLWSPLHLQHFLGD